MARYIDAERLRDWVKTQVNPYGKPTLEYASGLKVLSMIDNEPAADVVEVVRCKDCKFARKMVSGDYSCLVDHRLAHNEDDHCSYGERIPQKEG